MQFKLSRNGGRFSVLLHTIFEDLILLFRLVVSMGYYGLSLNTGNLSGDFYINFLLSGLAEFPAYTLCLLLLDRIGRRKLHVSCMILGGVACICTIFTMLYAGEGRAIWNVSQAGTQRYCNVKTTVIFHFVLCGYRDLLKFVILSLLWLL